MVIMAAVYNIVLTCITCNKTTYDYTDEPYRVGDIITYVASCNHTEHKIIRYQRIPKQRHDDDGFNHTFILGMEDHLKRTLQEQWNKGHQ